MARALWLADVLRSAGLQVAEVTGWKTRGSDTFDPKGLIAHATAGSKTATDAAELRVILEGSATAPPPISQFMLGRTGIWYVVASGRCNHALTGTAGRLKGYGNSNLFGVEGCNDNRGEPWNNYEPYVRGVAAIMRHLGWNPEFRISGHKEHQPGQKTDPTFSMDTFRADVARYISNPQGEEDMAIDANDPSYVDLIFRVKALYENVDNGGHPPIGPNGTRAELAAIKAATAALLARPPVQATPIDPASLVEALLHPDVQAVLVAAATAGANAAEDS